MGKDSELAIGLVQGWEAGSIQVGADVRAQAWSMEADTACWGAAPSFDIHFYQLDFRGICSRGKLTPHEAMCKRMFTVFLTARKPSNRETAH